MIDASQISDEVAEAAAKAAYEVERALWDEARRIRRNRHVPSLPVWDNLSDARRRALICMSRAASAAVINAWPGIAPFSFYTADGPRDGFILPLTQENNNGSD